MSGNDKTLVAFDLDGQCYGLHIEQVDRVIRAAAPTELPGGPAIVLGVLDIHGVIAPVFNIRRRFGRPDRAIDPDDPMIIARAARRKVVLPADGVRGIVTCSVTSIARALEAVPVMRLIDGVIKLADGLLLIHDLEAFLTPEEGSTLKRAMAAPSEGDIHG